ncbi:MAG: hypothetical protein K9N00_01220 [Candidatus Marinimicrobia bacterium]|nr:hypothetical protein [Candidatus Neomarinimicrobiota bacterium]
MTKKLTELKEKIISNAEQEAEKIRSRAEKVRDRTLRTARRKADRIVSKAEEQQEDRFAREKQKIEYEQEIQTRKKRLAIEQEIFNDLTKDLQDRLHQLFQNGHLDDWILDQVESILPEGEENFTLLCNPKDGKQLQSIFKKKDIPIEEQLSQTGFILTSAKDEYDFTFSTLAENLVAANKEKLLKSLHNSEDFNG